MGIPATNRKSCPRTRPQQQESSTKKNPPDPKLGSTPCRSRHAPRHATSRPRGERRLQSAPPTCGEATEDLHHGTGSADTAPPTCGEATGQVARLRQAEFPLRPPAGKQWANPVEISKIRFPLPARHRPLGRRADHATPPVSPHPAPRPAGPDRAGPGPARHRSRETRFSRHVPRRNPQRMPTRLMLGPPFSCRIRPCGRSPPWRPRGAPHPRMKCAQRHGRDVSRPVPAMRLQSQAGTRGISEKPW